NTAAQAAAAAAAEAAKAEAAAEAAAAAAAAASARVIERDGYFSDELSDFEQELEAAWHAAIASSAASAAAAAAGQAGGPPPPPPPPGAQRRMHRPTDQQAGSRTGGTHGMFCAASPSPPPSPSPLSPPPGAQRRMHRPADQQAGSRTGGTHGMFCAGGARARVVPTRVGPSRFSACPLRVGEYEMQPLTMPASEAMGSSLRCFVYHHVDGPGHILIVGECVVLKGLGVPHQFGLYYGGSRTGQTFAFPADFLGMFDGETIDEVTTECTRGEAERLMLNRDGRGGQAPSAYCILLRRAGWCADEPTLTPGWRLVEIDRRSPLAYANSCHGTGRDSTFAVDQKGAAEVISSNSGFPMGALPATTTQLTAASALLLNYALPPTPVGATRVGDVAPSPPGSPPNTGCDGGGGGGSGDSPGGGQPAPLRQHSPMSVDGGSDGDGGSDSDGGDGGSDGDGGDGGGGGGGGDGSGGDCGDG
uniref:Uncharacterized protein n=2 Tax=Emiliania huxleyi TaxID=2903 RepID=A0A0D3IW18_EMIH1